MSAASFQRCLFGVLQSEGGNDDDPDDPGGRTSRGITQSDYDRWLAEHGGTHRDVWLASDDQIASIYSEYYWEPLNCSNLPDGLDYVVFDTGVLCGVKYAATSLQHIVGAKPDGMIGPLTLAAVAKHSIEMLVIAMTTDRLAYCKTLNGWAKYGKGWTNRATAVEKQSMEWVSP